MGIIQKLLGRLGYVKRSETPAQGQATGTRKLKPHKKKQQVKERTIYASKHQSTHYFNPHGSSVKLAIWVLYEVKSAMTCKEIAQYLFKHQPEIKKRFKGNLLELSQSLHSGLHASVKREGSTLASKKSPRGLTYGFKEWFND